MKLLKAILFIHWLMIQRICYDCCCCCCWYYDGAIPLPLIIFYIHIYIHTIHLHTINAICWKFWCLLIWFFFFSFLKFGFTCDEYWETFPERDCVLPSESISSWRNKQIKHSYSFWIQTKSQISVYQIVVFFV